MALQISSRDNSHFKRWQSLKEKRGIKKHNQFLASGKKIVAELCKKATPDSELLLIEAHDAPSDFPGKLYTLSNELFKELDEFGTHSPLLVGPLPQWPTWDQALQPNNGLNLICPLGDPSNLGALIRTATALKVNKIILTQESAHPLLPKSLRSSAGCVLNAPICMGPSLTEILKFHLNNAFVLDLYGEKLNEFQWPKNVYLIVGEEGPGLPQNDFKKLSIPISDNVESLNAVVAASLAIWTYSATK